MRGVSLSLLARDAGRSVSERVFATCFSGYLVDGWRFAREKSSRMEDLASCQADLRVGADFALECSAVVTRKCSETLRSCSCAVSWIAAFLALVW